MTHHEPNEFSKLNRAIDAINSQSITDGPPSDLVTSTVEALQANDTPVAPTLKRSANRREMMIRLAKYGERQGARQRRVQVVGRFGNEATDANQSFSHNGPREFRRRIRIFRLAVEPSIPRGAFRYDDPRRVQNSVGRPLCYLHRLNSTSSSIAMRLAAIVFPGESWFGVSTID